MAGKGQTEEMQSNICKEDFMIQQTMLRVKDPAKSLEFYTGVLGMTLLQKIDFPSMRFSNYFLGYEEKCDIPQDVKERTAWTFSRRATVELTHNWGSEKDENLLYHNGNAEPRGFVSLENLGATFLGTKTGPELGPQNTVAGHIGIAVPDLEAACKVFEKQGVTFVKKPHSGKMKDLAFIQDPDGYWIEILSPANMVLLMST